MMRFFKTFAAVLNCSHIFLVTELVERIRQLYNTNDHPVRPFRSHNGVGNSIS